MPVPCHAGAFSGWPAVWLERDDDTGFQQVLERADYLAKEHTKAHCTGERNLASQLSTTGAPPGKPKVWVVVWRQLSTRDDCFTSVFHCVTITATTVL